MPSVWYSIVLFVFTPAIVTDPLALNVTSIPLSDIVSVPASTNTFSVGTNVLPTRAKVVTLT